MPSSDAKILAIRERINYESLFSEFLTLTGRGNERMARCIFHDDSHASMSVNVDEGLYNCFNPDCDARGDFIDFYRRLRSLTFTEALNELGRKVGLNFEDESESFHIQRDPADLNERHERLLESYVPQSPQPTPIVDEAIVTAMHERLVATPAWVEWLSSVRGINRETIDRFLLGHDGQRYYIPVKNAEGETLNIRRYSPNARRSQDKMISWRTGYGTARLFPLNHLADGIVYLFEGEMDCLLARQLGLNALTTTGGAGTWRGEEWNGLFEGRDVVVCYDADAAGRAGSMMVANQLADNVRSVRIAHIPLAEPPGADFTDFIVGHGHSVADFLRLAEDSVPFSRNDAREAPPQPEVEPVHLHLSHASQAEFYNKPVRFSVMVSGKTTSPYLVPESVRMGCPASVRGTLDMCDRCPVQENGGPLLAHIQFESNDILQFTDVPVERLQKTVKIKVGVPGKCSHARYDVVDAINVEKVQLIPEVERTEEEAPYVTREAYYVGHGLQANRSYTMTGVTVPEPRKQLATHIIHSAIQSQSNIDSFRLTDDVIYRMRAFSPAGRGVMELWRHLALIYEDLERHTRIYQRRDLMLAVDLVYHSVLGFKFQGEQLARGWTEALIIGDSRTGKSTIVNRMLNYYGAGEFTTGENTTLAGLIGGLHQIGTSWVLQWGRIPLNDRRLMVVDEAGNLPPDQIARLSSMRSSGIAEVIKVHTERTWARTRQIWISNPREPRPLSSFTQGVLAVKNLIGAPEDIARFDMVVSSASGDVPLAVVNAEREFERPRLFEPDLCHQRVMWAWSRSSGDVVWGEGATQKVLELATEQGERYRYATDIPLVEPNEQRVKLARLAVATAVMFFSASEDGEKVIVQTEHVDFAAQFLEALYSKPSLAFAEYADHMRARYTITDEHRVSAIFVRNPNAVGAFMEQDNLTQRDIQEILSFNDRDELRGAITTLRDCGFLRRYGSSFYQKTPAAIQWLRGRVSQNGHFGGLPVLEGEYPDEPPF
jgi:hypothetical protein